MAKMILVPGAWHGPWCFAPVLPLLRAAGHEVVAIDLPVNARAMADWVGIIVDEIGAGPAILVGHSRGGAVISAVAQAAPARVARLIFLSGFLLQNGQTVLGAAQADILLPVQTDMQHGQCTLAADPVPYFYADCSAADREFARARLRPEPLFGLMTPAQLTQDRFGRVPRDYIECTQDRAITLAAQRRMQAAWPVQRVQTLETSHSPFFSNPKALAASLNGLAAGP